MKSQRFMQWLVLVQTLPYLAILPWDVNSRWWLHEPLLVALCLPVLPVLWRTRTIPRGYWLFLGWCALTVCYAPEPKVAIGRLLPMILLLAGLAHLISEAKSLHDVQFLLGGFLKACGLLVALNAAALILFYNSVSYVGDWGAYAWVAEPETYQTVNVIRFCGLMGDPNAVGALMLAVVPAGILHWSACRWRKLLFCTMLASVAMAAMADSRTPFVALALGLAGWLAFVRRGLKWKMVAAAGLIVLFTLAHSNNPYISRGAADMNGRTWMWQWEVRKVAEHPIGGYGYGIEGLLMQGRDFPSWDLAFQDPHASLQNGYLSLAIESGLPALFAFLFFFLRPWPIALHSRSRFFKTAFWIIIVPALVFAMSESGIAEPRDPAGLLVFLIWLVAECHRITIKAQQVNERRELQTRGRLNFGRLLACG